MSISTPSRTILLVEDEALIAMNEAALLEKHGYKVQMVTSGEKAVAAVRDNEFDLILMDIDLGKNTMMGTEAAEIILENNDIPLVFLSSHTDPAIVEKTEGITSYGYVVKDSGNTVLLASLKMAFRLFEAKKFEKQNEVLLKRLQAAGKASNFGIWIWNTETKEVWWSEGLYAIYGRDPQLGTPPQEINKWVEETIYFEDRERLQRAIENTIANKTNYDIKYRIIRNDDKHVRWLHASGSMEPDKTGKPVILLGSVQDITEQKQIEKLLQETGRMAKVGGWELDAESLGVFWTEETYRIHELPLGYNPPLNEAVNFFHPDDRDILSEAIDHALKEGKSYDLELRFVTANGKNLWVHTKCTPILKDAEVVKLTGTVQDITDRKIVEESLRQSEEKYQRLMNNSPDLIYRMSLPDGRYEFVSPAVFDLFGYRPEEFLNNPLLIRNIIHPDWHDYFATQWNNLLKGDVPPTYEYQIVKKSGEAIWVNQRNMLYTDEHNNPIAIEGIVSDITEQKHAEKQRDILMHELNHRTKNNLIMISSLIRMKDSSLGDAADLTDLIQRTNTISLAYEKLQQFGNSTYIDVQGYIQDILSAVFALTKSQVRIKEKIDNIPHIPELFLARFSIYDK